MIRSSLFLAVAPGNKEIAKNLGARGRSHENLCGLEAIGDLLLRRNSIFQGGGPNTRWADIAYL